MSSMTPFRYSMARVRGRGAGLGNELIPWARAFLAAQVTGATCLPPAFGMNTRRYWRHFGTSRLDWLHHRALQSLLPVVEFDEAAFDHHGGGDVVDALRRFALAEQLATRAAYVLVTDGMWGGYRHIRAARDFIRTTLYASRFAPANLIRLNARIDPSRLTVGMHVRMGDFQAASDDLTAYRGKFNLSLPTDWYRNVARSIRATLGDRVQFLVVSDGPPAQLAKIFEEVPFITSSDIPDADCSDLLALADADLLVCSVSSFSTMAAFLSSAPYLWFEPNLQRHAEQAYSIWGHESAQQRESGETMQSLRASAQWQTAPDGTTARGVPVSYLGAVAPALLERLYANKQACRPERDLICYGVVPIRQPVERTALASDVAGFSASHPL